VKEVFRWHSPHVEQEIQLVRWGTYGTPVLLFPTAGGDAEEAERFHLIGSVGHLIESGRIKVYSVDSIAGKACISKQHSAEFCS
jgi:esterase/lipase superfamily enzyme